ECGALERETEIACRVSVPDTFLDKTLLRPGSDVGADDEKGLVEPSPQLSDSRGDIPRVQLLLHLDHDPRLLAARRSDGEYGVNFLGVDRKPPELPAHRTSRSG